MNFRPRQKDEPEINLIPFIDVLLVILIFLMLSTTYSKFTELQLNLPVADTQAQRDYPKEVLVTVSADGAYSVNRVGVAGRAMEDLASAMANGATYTCVPSGSGLRMALDRDLDGYYDGDERAAGSNPAADARSVPHADDEHEDEDD